MKLSDDIIKLSDRFKSKREKQKEFFAEVRKMKREATVEDKGLDPRWSKKTFDEMFPKRDDGLCRCGCGLEAKFEWYSAKHKKEAYSHYRLLKDPRYVRKKVWERDEGICQQCGLDLREFQAKYKSGEIDDAWIKKNKYNGKGKSFWMADHLQGVAHGGGLASLEDYQLLCNRCHRLKTNEEIKRLYAERKKRKKEKQKKKIKEAQRKIKEEL